MNWTSGPLAYGGAGAGVGAGGAGFGFGLGLGLGLGLGGVGTGVGAADASAAFAARRPNPRVALSSLVVHGSKSLATLADLDLRPGFAFLAAKEDPGGAGSLQAALRSARLRLGLDAVELPSHFS